jgi:DNA polymerase-3 subunit alpha
MIPDSFNDIVALVALFRPGPMLMADDFINRKNGKEEIDYLHPDLKPVLKNTYGVMLYQEQVMQIARVLANFTMAQADLLRAAMSSKDHAEMARQRIRFLKGATERGVAEARAAHIFDLMEKFAGYGFNKAHSVSYALVAYQTAWLKVHHPADFMAAVLSVDMQNTDKIVTNIDESRQLGLEIVPPDVNRGSFRFVPDGRDRIIYGLGAIKGLGEGPIENLVQSRASGGPFGSFHDFCERIDLHRVNKRAIEALIGSGALDFVVEAPGPLVPVEATSWKRAWLIANQEGTIRLAEQKRRERASGHQDLFGGVDAGSYGAITEIHPLSDRQRLQGEKETLGLYLTGHPFDVYAAELKQLPRTAVNDLRVTNDAQTVAGMVMGLRTMKSKRGETIAFITLDDRSGRIEVSLNGELYDTSHDKVQKDSVLVIRGTTSNDDFSGGIRMRAVEVWDLLQARARAVKRMLLSLDAQELTSDFPARLANILKPYRGGDGCPVVIDYRGDAANAEVRLGDRWRVTPHDDLIQQLRDQFGKEVVRLDY